MSTTNVSAIIEALVAAGRAYEKDEAGARDTLIDLSAALTGALEIPSEFLQRVFWAQPCIAATCRIAVKHKIFQHLRDAGETGLSIETLIEKTGVNWDVRLFRKLLRHLTAYHVISYRQGRWCGTELSNGLAAQNFQSSIEFCYDSGMPSFYQFPDCFEANDYQLPSTDIVGPFQFAHKSKLDFFPWLEANPPNLANFAQFMSAYRAGKPSWFDPGFYPVEERLISGFDPTFSDVLLVDVGGGKGHDVLEFAAKYASHPGKIVLQDQALVLAGIEVKEPPFEATAHDFFTHQPVKARAYALHSILHDWGDDEGVKIIENLKPALKPGYSRVLFFEIVISDDHPSQAATTMDIQMLAHLNGGERTELDWRKIIEKRGGLVITNIFTYPGVAESLIEAELPAAAN